MPKRKSETDIDRISKKLKRLERKLRRAKQKENLPPEHKDTAAENPLQLQDNVPEISTEVPTDAQTVVPTEVPADVPADLLTDTPQVLPALSTNPNDTEEVCLDAVVEDNLEEILGEDPTENTEYAKDIHVGVSNRLEHIIINGLDSDTRKDLGKKYLCPANYIRIIPPLLNPEIKAALPELSVKRDKGLENRQKQVGSVISCLTQIITSQLQDTNKNQTLIKQLMDAAKLMCDTLHSDSAKRRYFASSSLKKDINEHLQLTKIDKYLFSEGLAETLKTAKAVTKSGDEIKVQNNSKKPPSNPPTRGLNWKAPPLARRQPGQQRSQQPYQPAGQRMMRQPPPPPPPARRPPPQHASSSKTSQYQPRQNRHY